ncbi:hypothetical protein N0V90_004007 [Kalmusia sp. IMI 367209]|nr:hypothetical protein N0V90_004007 [Kalmusia sp. IMI 367209]
MPNASPSCDSSSNLGSAMFGQVVPGCETVFSKDHSSKLDSNNRTPYKQHKYQEMVGGREKTIGKEQPSTIHNIDILMDTKTLRPLAGDNIRLLILQPGSFDGPIYCQLEQVSLGAGHAYTALSYVWGNASDTSSISLDGKSYNITKNLECALRRLRYNTSPRVLWVDAVCIDQRNIKEKTHQVNMMGSIYKKCMQCLVWLGEIPTEVSEFTFSDASAALDFITMCAEYPESLTEGIVDIFYAFKGIVNDFTGPVRGLDIGRLGENPLNMFQRWRYRNATDPRDKVYALMGLTGNMSLPTVQSCDYSIGTVSLYTAVTLDLIALEGGLRPLVGLRPVHSPDLPTWAIDLSRHSDVEASYSWWDHSHRYEWFDASWGKNLEWDRLEGDSVLSLSGVFIGHVEDIGSASTHANVMEISEKELTGIIGSWKNVMARYVEFRNPYPEYPNGSSLEDAFWRTMIGDLVTAEFPRQRAEYTDCQLVSEFYQNGTISEILTSLRCMIVNQGFFITREGYIGIGPPDMAKGDEAWVLFGGNVPFILRPLGHAESWKCKNSNDYTLVGNAYVHGIMDGEAIDRPWNPQQNIRLH